MHLFSPEKASWMLSVDMHAINPFEACVQELVGRTCNAFQPVTGVRTITAASRDQADEEPDSIDAVLGTARPTDFYSLTAQQKKYQGLDLRSHPLHRWFVQRPELDAALVEKATVALAIIGAVCRFAISADLVEERAVARDLGFLLVLDPPVLDQYSTFLTPRRSASTAYSTFVHLKRICEELRHAIHVDHGCTKNLERGGRSTHWCSSYKRKRDGTWGPVYYKDAEIERVLAKLTAAQATLTNYCKSHKRRRESSRTVGQLSFATRFHAGELLCVVDGTWWVSVLVVMVMLVLVLRLRGGGGGTKDKYDNTTNNNTTTPPPPPPHTTHHMLATVPDRTLQEVADLTRVATLQLDELEARVKEYFFAHHERLSALGRTPRYFPHRSLCNASNSDTTTINQTRDEAGLCSGEFGTWKAVSASVRACAQLCMRACTYVCAGRVRASSCVRVRACVRGGVRACRSGSAVNLVSLRTSTSRY